MTILVILFSFLLGKAETNFQYAYKKILEHEGNYVYHPDDKGGETYRGITKKYASQWYGWRYVNKTKNKVRYQDIPQANFWAQDYYLTIWIREGFDKIHDKKLAAYLFDYRINAYTAPKEIRKVLNVVGLCIPISNKFTAEVAECVNVAPNWLLKNRLENTRTKHYKRIASRNETQKQFLSHWLKRSKFSNY